MLHHTCAHNNSYSHLTNTKNYMALGSFSHQFKIKLCTSTSSSSSHHCLCVFTVLLSHFTKTASLMSELWYLRRGGWANRASGGTYCQTLRKKEALLLEAGRVPAARHRPVWEMLPAGGWALVQTQQDRVTDKTQASSSCAGNDTSVDAAFIKEQLNLSPLNWSPTNVTVSTWDPEIFPSSLWPFLMFLAEEETPSSQAVTHSALIHYLQHNWTPTNGTDVAHTHKDKQPQGDL